LMWVCAGCRRSHRRAQRRRAASRRRVAARTAAGAGEAAAARGEREGRGYAGARATADRGRATATGVRTCTATPAAALRHVVDVPRHVTPSAPATRSVTEQVRANAAATARRAGDRRVARRVGTARAASVARATDVDTADTGLGAQSVAGECRLLACVLVPDDVRVSLGLVDDDDVDIEQHSDARDLSQRRCRHGCEHCARS
jgi:hypothetical protein